MNLIGKTMKETSVLLLLSALIGSAISLVDLILYLQTKEFEIGKTTVPGKSVEKKKI